MDTVNSYFEIAVVSTVVITIVALLFTLQRVFTTGRKTRADLHHKLKTRIAKARDGEVVKIVGEVRGVDEPLSAPLSGKRCLCWEVVVEELVGTTGLEENWKPIIHEAGVDQFVVTDDTGKALVRPERARLALVKTETFHQWAGEPSDMKLIAFLNAHDTRPRDRLGISRSLRFREGVIREKASVAVLGTARWELDPDPTGAAEGYRASPKRLVLSAPSGAEILISDDVKTFN